METRSTKSGIFYRKEEFGYLIFNPFTGHMYACKPNNDEIFLNWLELKSKEAPDDEFQKIIGAGWDIQVSEAEYPTPHIIPRDSAQWEMSPYSETPIVINWLITGNCYLKCKYCYAEDLMRGKYPEPTSEELDEICINILRQNPLVVVVTGGDPLISNNLERILSNLYSKTGIILDTSGYKVTDDHIKLFKKFNVFIRVSIDSERNAVNNRLRPPLAAKGEASLIPAIKLLDQCLVNKIGVSVQTVVTKVNQSDLIALGDKLFKAGLKAWRLMLVAPSEHNMENYIKYSGSKKSKDRFTKTLTKLIKSKYENDWKKNMSVYITENNVPNAIILVSPDGRFLTESNLKLGDSRKKIIIDPDSPLNPDEKKLRYKIDFQEHAKRYLNS